MTTSAPYTVEASLFKESPAGNIRLVPGASVGVGDGLFVEFRASRETWVYVVNEDEQGARYVLFPMPGFDLTNPLPAGRTLRLPGEHHSWKVNSRGGRERLLVVVSPTRPEEFEEKLAGIPTPMDGVPTLLDDGALTSLRGIGGIAKAAPSSIAEESGFRFTAYAPLPDGAEKVEGSWA